MGWSMLFVPCFLWSCMPPWQDVCLLSTFLMSQVLFYSMQHVRGALILSTLVLLLWTKNLFGKWYRSQVLTREFFKNLLYLVVSVALAVTAVLLVWMPLYEAYACMVSSLDKATARTAMAWRNTVFLLAALALALSAVAQTDLVLRPSQMDNTGLNRLSKKMTTRLCRMIRILLRQLLLAFRASCRCVRAVYSEFCTETKTLASLYSDRSHEALGDHCAAAAAAGGDQKNLPRQCGRPRTSEMCTRRTRGKRVGFTQQPQSTYASQSGSTRRLRSSDRKTSPGKPPAFSPQPNVVPAKSRGAANKYSPRLANKTRRRVGRPLKSSVDSVTPIATLNTNLQGSDVREPVKDQPSVVDSTTQLLNQCVTPKRTASGFHKTKPQGSFTRDPDSHPFTNSDPKPNEDTTSDLQGNSATPASGFHKRKRRRSCTRDYDPSTVSYLKPNVDTTSNLQRNCVTSASGFHKRKPRGSYTRDSDPSTVNDLESNEDTTSSLQRESVTSSSSFLKRNPQGSGTRVSDSATVSDLKSSMDTTSKYLRQCVNPASDFHENRPQGSYTNHPRDYLTPTLSEMLDQSAVPSSATIRSHSSSSLAQMLHRSVSPSRPRTRSQAPAGHQPREGAQTRHGHSARHEGGQQHSHSLRKAWATKGLHRWCPDCD